MHKDCVALYLLAQAADAQLPVLCPQLDCRKRLPSASTRFPDCDGLFCYCAGMILPV